MKKEIMKQSGNGVQAAIQEYINGKISLEELTEPQLRKIMQAVTIDELKHEFTHKADMARVDYPQERAAFINQVGTTDSANSRLAYNAALDRLDAWASRQGIFPLDLTPRTADDFIYSLRTENRSAASIRLDISACSSFYTFLERRHDFIRNAFRGTRARPARVARRKLAIPEPAEIEAIADSLPQPFAAAVRLMADMGFRVGALEALTVKGDGSYFTRSKGKDIAGTLSQDALRTLRKAAIDRRQPFAGISTNVLRCRIKYAVNKLHALGILKAKYSVHDLRHAFAVREYRKDHDIYKLKVQLHHASIQVTENYLRSLDEGIIKTNLQVYAR